MKTLKMIIVLLFCGLFFMSCSKEPTQSEEPVKEWKTIFFDDFNRANTVNGDLGSNWIVCDTTNVSIMQIINNEVHAEREVPALYEPDICPMRYIFKMLIVKALEKRKSL